MEYNWHPYIIWDYRAVFLRGALVTAELTRYAVAIEMLLVRGRFEQMASDYDPSGRYKEQLTLVPFAEKK